MNKNWNHIQKNKQNTYKLVSENIPRGDQPEAIAELTNNILKNQKKQILLGVTGSGKTFTIANVIKNTNRPALVLSHNKTLASQLYTELKLLFPENKVEYFVSHFDYYRPESYVPSKDLYTEKSSKTNWDLESMRMSAMNAILTRSDTIIVSSVAAIYGALNPQEYEKSFFYIEKNLQIKRSAFFRQLTKIGYLRNNVDLSPGNFRVKGDVVEIFPGWSDEFIVRVDFFDDEIESISLIDYIEKTLIKKQQNFVIYPASSYTVTNNTIGQALITIREELQERLLFFEKNNLLLEKQRLEQRVKNDLDSLEEFGTCPGIENYARHMDQRLPGEKPYTLIDYLPNNTLIIIDESHITVPQLLAMYKGDYTRKKNLVDYGFRLPSALDNRPLKFEEFEKIDKQTIYVSATPGKYELDQTNGEIVTQIIRPTGLLDPIIEIKPTKNQLSVILDEIQKQISQKERTIIITNTKMSAEQISQTLRNNKIKSAYIHSEHKTFERNEILRKLRKGIYDVVVGVHLLKEGIDLPEVSLIMILDADVASFSRTKSNLIQMIGRVARNDHGRAILFADKINSHIQETLDDNKMKRKIQIAYNKKHNIIPKTIIKPIPEPIELYLNDDDSLNKFKSTKKSKNSLDKLIKEWEKKKQQLIKEDKLEEAIKIRDLILELKSEQ
ncbi:excinuclease ABC subunit UvrB [Mesomycoplasma neurolyticum]|uniref:UvrABC system protein B n=1 Tax=Mesomycoplasma neurolyticum TaxID=2120 RepID=A0A449A631_9BACT|nr:excinuclease ABC subunit UvrB [Mesomycoplasma neurolyticum]VEU59613.1 UvrABC system protein B [Mesomycoplasma neurolyticum]